MMAISTQTEALIELYTQKVELDKKQLEQINYIQAGYTIKTGIGESDQIKVWGPEEVIQSYDVPITKIDNQIIQINDEIKILQNQVLSLGQESNTVGCGTTSTVIEVYEDQLKYKGYAFSGSNPFNTIQGDLNSGNSGIGTYSYTTQVSIGTYYGPTGTCYGLFTACALNPSLCPGYASSITTLNSQIVTLQSERDDLLEKVNFLKNGRIDSELQNYGYNQSKVKLNGSIAGSNSILSFLQDPANEEWL